MSKLFRFRWLLWGLLCGTPLFTYAQNEPVTQAEVKKLKTEKADDLWYVDQPLPAERPPVKKPEKVQWPAGLVTFFKIIAWATIAFVLIYILYGLFTNLKRPEPPVSEVVYDDVAVENADQLRRIDFRTSIQQAVQAGNYRLAVRYYYLWAIQELHKQRKIRFGKAKTNQDYLRELEQNAGANSDIVRDFRQCTRLYEYVWFGNYPPDAATFQQIENAFQPILHD